MLDLQNEKGSDCTGGDSNRLLIARCPEHGVLRGLQAIQLHRRSCGAVEKKVGMLVHGFEGFRISDGQETDYFTVDSRSGKGDGLLAAASRSAARIRPRAQV